MSLKEKYQEYKQKQEAKAYFRSQNSMRIDNAELPAILISGFLPGLVIAVISAMIEVNGMHFMALDLLIGYVVAEAMVHKRGFRSKHLAGWAVVVTLICFIMKSFVFILVMNMSLGLAVSLNVVVMAVVATFTQSMLDLLFMVCGLVIAYQRAR